MLISQDQLLKIYDDKTQKILLIDVRTPAEFSTGHIPNSINIPIDQLDQVYQTLPPANQIITICQHGFRSGLAADFLNQNQPPNSATIAKSLEHGLSNWRGQLLKT